MTLQKIEKAENNKENSSHSDHSIHTVTFIQQPSFPVLCSLWIYFSRVVIIVYCLHLLGLVVLEVSFPLSLPLRHIAFSLGREQLLVLGRVSDVSWFLRPICRFYPYRGKKMMHTGTSPGLPWTGYHCRYMGSGRFLKPSRAASPCEKYWSLGHPACALW